jgi:signal transduction histidine kinase
MPLFGMAQQQSTDSLKKVLKIAQADSARYSALSGIGEYYVEINGDSALYYLNRALAIAKKNDRAINEGATLARIGYVLIFKGKYPESLECFQQALKLAEVPANDKTIWNPNMSWIPFSTPQKTRLTILAGTHLLYSILADVTGESDEQIVHIKLSRAFAREAGDDSFEAVANMNLGIAYQETNRSLDSALLLLQNAARTFERTGYKKYLGGDYGKIGAIYLDKGNADLAVQYFHKGLNLSIQQKNFALADFNYAALARYYLAKKQKDSSLYYARKRLDIVHVMNSSNQDQAYEGLYRSYQLEGKTDSAYKYQGLALAARDKKYESTVKSLADFQKLSFKVQLRAQALEKERATAQSRLRTYLLLGAMGVFMLLAAIFYRNNRQKQKANEVLESTLDNLKATQTQLIQSEKMASLGELTAGIAHEIQNPLNFVNNFSDVNREMLEELKTESEKPKAERDEQLEKELINDLIENEGKIKHHGKRADNIVKGMLEHSRVGTGERAPTDINALADEFLKLSYHGLRAKDKEFNAELITNFDTELPKANVVPQDLGRTLLNLFNNAFYAVNQKQKADGADYKPMVEVSTSAKNRQIEIRVRDNGNGIPDTIKDKIMQPFFTTKPTGEGTGLGLSLSHDIVVKGHGGKIEVNTKEGEGAEFIIQLPIS